MHSDVLMQRVHIIQATSPDMHPLLQRTDAGHRLLARYQRSQNDRHLDQSIEHFDQASNLCPVDHPCRSVALLNLATAKFISCQANGTYLDLDIPISLLQEALELRPTGHPDRPVTQLHLAIALLSRYSKRGFQADSDEGKELMNQVLGFSHVNSHVYRAALLAVETFPLHTARSADVHDLGWEQPIASMFPRSPDELGRRVQLCRDRDDPRALDEVISLHYDALQYYGMAHPQRPQLLCNLSVVLITRFECRGNDQDLDEAIELQKEALAFCPIGHPQRSTSLNNIAGVLRARFKHRGNGQDLDEALSLHKEALALRPVGHPDRSSSLNDIANVLSTRFNQQGNDQDLDEALLLHREALALRPVGHRDRPLSLHNIACVLSICFKHRRNDEHLNESLEHAHSALSLMEYNPRRLLVHQLLANIYLLFNESGRHSITGDHAANLNTAMHHLRTAAHFVPGGMLFRLRVSLQWVQSADQYEHSTLLDAYATSMKLLDAYMSVTASVSSRHNTMKLFPPTLAVHAASCALRAGDA